MTDPVEAMERIQDFGTQVLLSGPFGICVVVVLALSYVVRLCGCPARKVVMMSVVVAFVLTFYFFKRQDMPPTIADPMAGRVATCLVVWFCSFLAASLLFIVTRTHPFKKTENTEHRTRKDWGESPRE